MPVTEAVVVDGCTRVDSKKWSFCRQNLEFSRVENSMM